VGFAHYRNQASIRWAEVLKLYEVIAMAIEALQPTVIEQDEVGSKAV
jgi:hypothetical protein